MSIQIEIAQSPDDEMALAKWLESQGDFRFHARIFAAGSFGPRPFAHDLGPKLQCFRVQDEGAVREHVSAIQPGRWKSSGSLMGGGQLEQIGPFNALSIEWIRTEWRNVTTCTPGRFYYDDRTPASEAIQGDLTKIMRRLVAMIRSSYPRRSDARHPCYVGPDLSSRIERGEARLLYPRGDEMRLVSNV